MDGDVKMEGHSSNHLPAKEMMLNLCLMIGFGKFLANSLSMDLISKDMIKSQTLDKMLP